MMVKLSALIAAFVVLSSVALAPSPRAASPLTVVELFTSQGCASCPPADAILARLAEQPGILPLSEHVDYWDYLGWKDPFALAETTARQKSYAERLGLPYVYTPQMIIQGSTQVMGSDYDEVLEAIAKAPPPEAVSVTIRRRGADQLAISVGAASLAEPVDLWLAVFDGRRAVEVEGGENSGRSLSYINVVRGLKQIGTWHGEAIDLLVSAPSDDTGVGNCAVLVQERNGGRILAAAQLTSP